MLYTSYIVENIFNKELAFCNLFQIILINNHIDYLKNPTFNVNDIICKSNRENCSKEVVFCVSSNFWRNVSNFFSRNVWYIILMISLFNHCFGHYRAVANEQLNIDLDSNTVCKKKTPIVLFVTWGQAMNWYYSLVFQRLHEFSRCRICTYFFLCPICVANKHFSKIKTNNKKVRSLPKILCEFAYDNLLE